MMGSGAAAVKVGEITDPRRLIDLSEAQRLAAALTSGQVIGERGKAQCD
jgi:hypothetical protein